MTAYTKYQRGSIWRKWDLHIHTPETKKNDQFEGTTPTEKWEKYIESINKSQEDISVIGITDYFSITNYFKFKDYVLNGTITKAYDLILPNIELRVLPVTGSSTPINLHCIFNPAIDGEIENRFLGKLKFTNSKSSYSATRNELIRFGRDHTNQTTLDEESAYRKGVEQYVISLDSLQQLFKSDPNLRDNTIIVVSNKSTDGVTGIIKHEDFFVSENVSQLDATRQGLYQFSDAIFSPNENDRNYFIGRRADDEKTVIRKCGTLKPCFHGCDAHSNDKIFNPDDGRFCWIKADPTFEGLKQTLYEPSDRVKVQSFKPDVKNERFIISELQFTDTEGMFGDQNILLNENLNAIIGGKSSGKSLLLFSTAKSIDPEQVDKASKRLNFEGYTFDSHYDFKVTWKDGNVDLLSNSDVTTKQHKIIYIPQLYINYLVEKNNKEELNSLIRNILLQDIQFKGFIDETEKSIEDTTSEIEKLLNEYLKVRNKALDNQKQSKETGNSENIKGAIKKIEADIALGQKASNLSEDEFKEYNRLLAEKSANDTELRATNLKEGALHRITTEVRHAKSNLLGRTDPSSQIYLKGQVDKILDEFVDIPEDVKSIKTKIGVDFDILISNLENEIGSFDLIKKKEELNERIVQNGKKLDPFLKKVEGQKELQKLTALLESEKLKLQNALTLEGQFRNLLQEYGNIRAQTAALLRKRSNFYKTIVDKVNSTKNNIGADIELKSSVVYKLSNLQLYDQVNKAAVSAEHFFNSLFSDGFVNYDSIPNFYEKPLKVADDKLIYGNEETIPLKMKVGLEEVLRGLIKDGFEVDYSVTYKGDNLLSMSPGKKGTVLLILFLQISSSEFPILIDQPEDNLDNRTIYELLCKIIKDRKKDRQIIIVSHNANLVVATDTENIIVANQRGQQTETETSKYRFEYVNGSLEHSFIRNETNKSILLRQGIREHVCDILEGGDEAFKQREKKYAIK